MYLVDASTVKFQQLETLHHTETHITLYSWRASSLKSSIRLSADLRKRCSLSLSDANPHATRLAVSCKENVSAMYSQTTSLEI